MCAGVRAALPGRRGHDPGAAGAGLLPIPRWPPIFASLLGLLPAGLRGPSPSANGSRGLTENQIVAAVLGFAALLLAFLMPSLRSLFTAGSAMAPGGLYPAGGRRGGVLAGPAQPPA